MKTVVAQIAPQRSTQYVALASALAPGELAPSPLGELIATMVPLELGGQAYLRIDRGSMAAPPRCTSWGCWR